MNNTSMLTYPTTETNSTIHRQFRNAHEGPELFNFCVVTCRASISLVILRHVLVEITCRQRKEHRNRILGAKTCEALQYGLVVQRMLEEPLAQGPVIKRRDRRRLDAADPSVYRLFFF